MKRSRWIQRVAVAVGATVVAAGVVPLITAGPAQAANYYDCVQYLRHKGYYIDDDGQAADACRVADRGNGSAYSLDICRIRLEGLGVSDKHSIPACRSAAKD
ncbi:hypothetical protein ACFWIY_33355 [Streptomyces sioyaensis]|uniref:hypothetical protein n=1 Tax=Streptomyces sioyaensis TaxID=67364 RepID=UPI003660BAF1